MNSLYTVIIRQLDFNPLTAKFLNLNFHPLEADAIHNFKWVKLIQIWQNGGQLFSNIADWCHILSLTCLKDGTQCANKKWTWIYATPAVKGYLPLFDVADTTLLHQGCCMCLMCTSLLSVYGDIFCPFIVKTKLRPKVYFKCITLILQHTSYFSR